MEKYKEIEKSIIKKYRKDIWSKFVKAVNDYNLIKEEDNIMVCISGGKDSFLLAKCIQELSRHGKIHFNAKYVVMNPGYTEINKKLILENAKLLNIPIEMFDSDIFDVTNTFDFKIACYGAELKTMMRKLHSTNFPGIELIRPLYLVKEEAIITWAKNNDLTFLNCACKYTEKVAESKENLSKRKEIKKLINDMKKINKNVDYNIFKALDNVNLNCILGTKKDSIYKSFLEDYDK